jgi:hypothetical protein
MSCFKLLRRGVTGLAVYTTSVHCVSLLVWHAFIYGQIWMRGLWPRIWKKVLVIHRAISRT